eukprot:gene2951-1933_t
MLAVDVQCIGGLPMWWCTLCGFAVLSTCFKPDLCGAGIYCCDFFASVKLIECYGVIVAVVTFCGEVVLECLQVVGLLHLWLVIMTLLNACNTELRTFRFAACRLCIDMKCSFLEGFGSYWWDLIVLYGFCLCILVTPSGRVGWFADIVCRWTPVMPLDWLCALQVFIVDDSFLNRDMLVLI